MRYNELESLESGLFQYNNKLEYVHFGWNRLTSIGRQLIVSTIKQAFFGNNYCINKEGNNPLAVQEVITEIKAKCPPTEDMMKREFFSTVNLKTLCEDSKLKIDNETTTSKLEDQQKPQDNEIYDLKKQVSELISHLNSQKSEMEIMKIELMRVRQTCYYKNFKCQSLINEEDNCNQ